MLVFMENKTCHLTIRTTTVERLLLKKRAKSLRMTVSEMVIGLIGEVDESEAKASGGDEAVSGVAGVIEGSAAPVAAIEEAAESGGGFVVGQAGGDDPGAGDSHNAVVRDDVSGAGIEQRGVSDRQSGGGFSYGSGGNSDVEPLKPHGFRRHPECKSEKCLRLRGPCCMLCREVNR